VTDAVAAATARLEAVRTGGRPEHRRDERARRRATRAASRHKTYEMPRPLPPDRRRRVWSRADVALVARRRPRWREDALGFYRFALDVLPGMAFTSEQQDVMASVAGMRFRPLVNGARKYGTAVKSGRGTGKTVVAALAILWKLMAFTDSLVLGTGPKERQVFDILWTKCKLFIDSSYVLRGFLDWTASRIGLYGQSPEWQAIARVAQRPEFIHGLHRPNFLVVVEEGSGVEDPIFDAIATGFTESDNFILANSNPTQPNGWFYDAHNSKRKLWDAYHMSVRNSPLVDLASILRTELAKGRNSPEVIVHIDGDFPPQSEWALVSTDWLNACEERAPYYDGAGDIRIGIDPARGGADRTAVQFRSGSDMITADAWQGLNGPEVARKVLELAVRVIAEEQRSLEELAEARRVRLRAVGQDAAAARVKAPRAIVTAINVDEIGVGASVVDALFEEQAKAMEEKGRHPNHPWLDCGIIPVNVSEAAVDSDRYATLRDEVWDMARDRFRDGHVAMRPGYPRATWGELRDELRPIEYKYPRGRFKAEDKDAMRKKIGRSPDHGDALNLAYYDEGVGFGAMAAA